MLGTENANFEKTVKGLLVDLPKNKKQMIFLSC